MKIKKLLFIFLFLSMSSQSGFAASSQFDPPRAGGPFLPMDTGHLNFFNDGLDVFQEVVSVAGTEPGAPDKGLGPKFNMNSCAGCHAFPAVGGSSPPVNPQIAVANRFGAVNQIPPFIAVNGPIREARFIKNPDGTPDGTVHQLFTITGRQDAPGCNAPQDDFDDEFIAGNVVFRIPTPVFGLGLVTLIPDSAIRANNAANTAIKNTLGIKGHPNFNANDHSISRFGWKAQNKSLLLFSGEAYNVEMGVTNELFPDENSQIAGCSFNAYPEDRTIYLASTVRTGVSDMAKFMNFMFFSAAPTPLPPTTQTTNGLNQFNKVGCVMCHTASFTTGKSSISQMSSIVVTLYSDLLVHHMGTGLADGITQGDAGPDEFRTAPLWGVGQRLFFLHDGRANTLLAAIQAHSSPGSEANTTIANFNKLTAANQNDLIAFLQSL